MKRAFIVAAILLAVVFIDADAWEAYLAEDPAVMDILNEFGEVFPQTYSNPWNELLRMRAPPEAFQRLLSLGAGIGLDRGQYGRPLMLAISSRNDVAVEFFLRHDADARRADARGLAPLVHAALSGTPRALELLINAGAGPDATAALLAVFARSGGADHADKARILLDAGADVNAASSDGLTALMMAARMNARADAIRLLISAGADVNAVSAAGQSALILFTANATNMHNMETIFVIFHYVHSTSNSNTCQYVSQTSLSTHPPLAITLPHSTSTIYHTPRYIDKNYNIFTS